MKVLWIVNTMFPYPASKLGLDSTCFGGWLNSMHSKIVENDEVEIAVATTYQGSKFLKYEDEKTKYYLIPDKNPSLYNKNLIKWWRLINKDFSPDIIHIHGTEYPKGLSCINADLNKPVVVSIQGLAGNVAKVYYGNIPIPDIIKNISFRDIVKFNTIFDCKKDFINRAKYEKEIIRKSNYVIGRTVWDKSNVLALDSNKKYFHLNECLRNEFYGENKWDINKIEKYSLFCSQSSYPIKGLHILLESINILKNNYPNIKLYISGMNIIDNSSVIARLKRIGYGKYINKLIKKFNLEDNVEFTGMLNAKQVVDRLLKTHIFISPSFIENESNSLTEASMLGVPAIGSYVGGVTERIIHGENGFHYPPTEPAMLAYYIKKIFDNDELSIKFSKNAIHKFTNIIDRNTNYKELYNIYCEIYRKEK